MRDIIHWKPHPTEYPMQDGSLRTVYARGAFVPFVGWMALPDTAFSCDAYVRIKGKRVKGYVGQVGENDFPTFNPYSEA